jgi:magnesium-transporting ATPase (P-type)
VHEVLDGLSVDPQAGLGGDADKRSERYGPNEIKETSRRGPLRIFVSQFADYIVAAVAEGRRIFDDIRISIKDTMSSNSGEIWTLFPANCFLATFVVKAVRNPYGTL